MPDYRDLKTELAELFEHFLRERMARHSGFIGTLPKVRTFEGKRTVLQRSAGDTSSNEYQRLEVSQFVPAAEAGRMTLRDVLSHLDEIAAKMAKEMSSLAIKQIDETLEGAGQVFDGKGEAMTATLLKAMDGIEMSFDADGKHQLTLVAHPEQAAAIEAAMASLDSDPALLQKYNALIERKWEQWRVREASRRLVG